jgi:hypothetical protein
MHAVDEKFLQSCSNSLKETDNFGDLGVYGKITLILFLKKKYMDRIYFDQFSFQERVILNEVR